MLDALHRLVPASEQWIEDTCLAEDHALLILPRQESSSKEAGVRGQTCSAEVGGARKAPLGLYTRSRSSPVPGCP